MDAKREMGNSNFEIINAKHETTVSNPEIRKEMMADGLDMGWLSIGLMGQRIAGQVGGSGGDRRGDGAERYRHEKSIILNPSVFV